MVMTVIPNAFLFLKKLPFVHSPLPQQTVSMNIAKLKNKEKNKTFPGVSELEFWEENQEEVEK